MSRIKSIKDGWDHPQSKIVEQASGTPGFKGAFVYHDVKFRFSVREQRPGTEYRLRGHIVILHPHTGQPLKETETALRVRENNLRLLKKAIAQKAGEMSAKFDKRLNSIFRNHAYTQAMYPLQLFRTFGNEYLRQRGRSPAYRKDLTRRLEKICGKLGQTPMTEITSTLIRQVYRECGRSARENILLAYQFFAFCRDRRAYPGDNPLERFIQEEFPRRKRGEAERLQQKAGEQKVFSKADKGYSFQLIREGLRDGRNMGVLLIGDGGLSAEQAAKLKWRDVTFVPDDFDWTILRLYKADNAGYTHCYDHPVFPYAGHLLHQRFELLAQEFGAETAWGLPVVSHAQDPRKPLTASTLTAFCKQHLRLVFAQRRGPMAPENAGVHFLQNDYNHRLSHICGMEGDSSAVRYLRGMSLTNDVTADSYRSFSGEDGQQYLYQYLCREQSFASLFEDGPQDAKPSYTVEETEGGTVLRIPGVPGMLTSASLALEVGKGTTGKITLEGKGGIELESTASRKLKNSK